MTDEPEGSPISRRASLKGLATLGVSAALLEGSSAVATRVPATPASGATGKLRYSVVLGEDFGTGGRFTAADVSAASREALRVVVPDGAGTNILDTTVELAPHTTIVGGGPDRSSLTSTAPLGFVFESAKGGDRAQAPAFEHVRLVCSGSGIRLNAAGHGFTDTGDTQSSLMGPRLIDVDLHGPGSARAGFKDSAGIEWNKVFRGLIDHSNIQGFGTGVLTRGCDFTELRGRTRIWDCATLVDLRRAGDGGYNYGSGTRLDGCDLLSAQHTYVRSEDNDLIVTNCYFEGGRAIDGYVLDLAGTNAQTIVSNRFEVPAAIAPRFLRQRGDLSLFVFETNNTDGPGWGAIDWNAGTGARYWKSVLRRQRLKTGGNITDMARLPYATIDPEPPAGRREPWCLTPGTAGLQPLNYGLALRVVDGAFVIPARAAYGSLTVFKKDSEPLSGLVSIHILAAATRPGQTMKAVRRDGAATAGSAAVRLGIGFQWYTLFANVAVADLAIGLYNDDGASGGDVLVRAIVVERREAAGT